MNTEIDWEFIVGAALLGVCVLVLARLAKPQPCQSQAHTPAKPSETKLRLVNNEVKYEREK